MPLYLSVNRQEELKEEHFGRKRDGDEDEDHDASNAKCQNF